jgi:molecular chaperone GrpE
MKKKQETEQGQNNDQNNEYESETKPEKKQKETHNEQHECITPEQLAELTDTLKRIQAEFENYKKRVDKENSQLIKNSNANLIKQLLPVLDSFELAIKNSNGNPEIDKFKKGLELIYTQLFSILADQGLRTIDTKDKKFDPYKHDVLLVKESDIDEDTILQEFQKGYMLNDIILRHSKVAISKHQPKDLAKDGQDQQKEDSHD